MPKQIAAALRREELSAHTIDHFWKYVRKRGPDECWPWIGAISQKTGYGTFSFRLDGKRRAMSAARFAFVVQYGSIEQRMEACHTCDVRLCMNGAHLWAGTHRQNMADCWVKDRVAHLKGETNPCSVFTPEDIGHIRADYAAGDTSYRQLGAKYGVSGVSIGYIVRGKRWGHIPLEVEQASA